MADECTDVSNKEQLAICFRWVDDDLEIHEEFVVPNISSDTLVSVIKDTLIRMNLSLGHCRGQFYDGASNMAGSIGGVAKQLRDEEE